MADTGKRRSGVVEGLIVLSLIILSAVLLLSLNSLSWPFGAQSSSNPVTTANESLGNLTVILGILGRIVPSATPASVVPASDVYVLISYTNTRAAVDLNATNSSGTITVSLRPYYYTVKIEDPRFNLSVDLEVFPAQTTTLHAVLNETDYPASTFDLLDSDSANYVGEWNEVYARVGTNQSIPTTGVSTYLLFVTSSSSSVPGLSPGSDNFTFVPSELGNTVPASILSSSMGDSSQWLQLKLNQFFSVEGVIDLDFLTRIVTYTVNPPYAAAS